MCATNYELPSNISTMICIDNILVYLGLFDIHVYRDPLNTFYNFTAQHKLEFVYKLIILLRSFFVNFI